MYKPYQIAEIDGAIMNLSSDGFLEKADDVRISKSRGMFKPLEMVVVELSLWRALASSSLGQLEM